MASDQKAEPTMKELDMEMKQFHEAYYVNFHSSSDREVAMIARDSDEDSSTEAPRNYRTNKHKGKKKKGQQLCFACGRSGHMKRDLTKCNQTYSD